jgi:hypothetical protein
VRRAGEKWRGVERGRQERGEAKKLEMRKGRRR